MATKVPNSPDTLRELLSGIYVAVLGHIPVGEGGITEDDWDALATTVLDASEGRSFEPLKLPWPPGQLAGTPNT